MATDDEVGDKLAKCLAGTLRESEGVPGLTAMAAVLVGTDGTSLLEQFSALDRIAHDNGGLRPGKIAAEVAKSFLVQQEPDGGAPALSDAVRQLAGGVCEAMVEHYFFANARQNHVTEGKIADHEEARQWQDRIEQIVLPAVERIADQLARSPNASGLRAPAGTVRRVPTSILLEEELVPSQVKSAG